MGQPVFSASRVALWEALWRAARGRRASLALLILISLALAVASLVPQLPPEAAESAADRVRWLAHASLSLGRWGAWGRAVGAFDVAHAPWWRALLALGAFHLALILADEARRAWQLSRGLPLPFPEDFRPLFSAPSLPREGVSRALAARVGPVVTTEREGVVTLLAARHPGAAWARPLACAGLLLVLIWALVGERFSWRDARLVLPPNEPVPLTRRPPLALRLLDGDPPRAAFVAGDQVVAEQRLAPGAPARYAGIGLHLLGGGPALLARGWGADGQPLSLQSITAGGPATYTLTLVFDQPRAERTFAVPAQRIAFRLIASPGNPFQVEIYRSDSDTPFLRTTLTGAGVLEVEGARYGFEPARYILVAAVHEPLSPLVPLGGGLIMLGLFTGLLRPTRLAWVRLRPEARGTAVEVATRRLGWPADDEKEQQRLAEALREVAGVG